jgi:hypothetical protein
LSYALDGPSIEAPMTNLTNKTIAACAGTIALACAAIQPAKAADMPPHYPPQYGGPPVVQERYVEERYGYQEPPPVYRAAPAPVYREYAPPALVPIPDPEPYYVPPRRVYVDPGYGAYGYGPGPYVARGYGYHRGWGHHHHHHHHAHRRW